MMMSYVKHNINDSIKVRLTKEGVILYYKYYEDLCERMKSYGASYDYMPKLKVDKEGYTEFQMWVFMEMFGQHFHLGIDGPIETTVLIKVEVDE